MASSLVHLSGRSSSLGSMPGQDIACVASVSVQFGSKELQGDEWSGSFLPLPYPHRSFFGSRPIFRAGKIPKTPFLGLSLLPNPTETLATQASQDIVLYSWTRHFTLSSSTLLQLYRLASHPGGSRSTPNRFILKKPG